MLLLILLQASSPGLPDIELRVQARARSVTIEQKGAARLELRAEPDGGSRVEAATSPKAEGRSELRNVSVDIKGEARLADPAEKSPTPETSPQDRR